MSGLPASLKYAFRAFRRNPLFTTIAVLSLALGIGANTAVFTLLDQLVLRLLPVKDPARLVMIWSTSPHLGNTAGPRAASYPMYQDFQRRAEAFESVFCRFDTPSDITLDGATERVTAELVSGNYFQALRVGPAIGRVFSAESDDQIYKGHPVVVLSHLYWINRFAADPNIIGKKILLNSYPMEIVGVAAPGFVGLDPSAVPNLWAPIQMKPLMTPGWDDLGNRRSQWIQIFARLKPGYTVESARASIQPLFHQILQQEVESPELSRISNYNRNRFLNRKALVETAANRLFRSTPAVFHRTRRIDVHGRPHPPHRVLKRSQSLDRQSRRASKGNRSASRPRSSAANPNRTPASRKRAAVTYRSGARSGPIRRSHARTAQHAPVQRSNPPPASHTRLANPPVQHCRRANNRNHLRPRPSHPGNKTESMDNLERRSRRRHRRQPTQPASANRWSPLKWRSRFCSS